MNIYPFICICLYQYCPPCSAVNFTDSKRRANYPHSYYRIQKSLFVSLLALLLLALLLFFFSLSNVRLQQVNQNLVSPSLLPPFFSIFLLRSLSITFLFLPIFLSRCAYYFLLYKSRMMFTMWLMPKELIHW
jgi:hypothetical protein